MGIEVLQLLDLLRRVVEEQRRSWLVFRPLRPSAQPSSRRSDLLGVEWLNVLIVFQATAHTLGMTAYAATTLALALLPSQVAL